jgi:transmembrane sensor
MSPGIEDDARVTEQAAQWLGALLDGNERYGEFFAWLAESPRHVEELLFMLADAQDIATLNSEQRARIEQLTREFGSAGLTGSNVVPVSQRALLSYETMLGNAKEAATSGPSGAGESSSSEESSPSSALDVVQQKTPRARRLGMRWMAGMAAALLIAFGAVLWVAGPGDWETYSTKVGEQRALELADGSIVHLNTDSKIAVRLTDTSRTVRLTQGEAFFTVEHDAKRPFLVHAADAVIQAIGTRFDVYRRPNSTRVSVIEGLVQISGGGDPVPAFPLQRVRQGTGSSADDEPHRSPSVPSSAIKEEARMSKAQLLAAGEAADISIKGEVSRRETVDALNAVAWRQRRLIFEEDTLGDIAAEFNRYNATLKIRVLGAAAVNEHFSGTFDADAPEAVMQALVGDSKLSVERIGNEIVIHEREAAQPEQERQ